MFLAHAPFWLQWYYPKLVWHKSRKEKKLYLTFDDGPTPEVTPWVLQLLKKYNIKATFFLIGKNIDNNPNIYEALKQNGHSIGNHTQNHLNGWKTSIQDYLNNIDICAKKIQTKLFRPPYGRIRKSASKQLIKQGYKIIMWDILSGDFDQKRNPKQCLESVKKYTQNGAIIVFHDSLKAQKNLQGSLEAYIQFALAKGYSFEAL